MRIHFISLMFPPLKAPRSIQIAHLASYIKSKVPLLVIHAGSESKISSDPSLLSFDLPKEVTSVSPSLLTRLLFSGRGDRWRKMLFPDPYFPWSFDLFRRAKESVSTGDIVVTFGQPMSVHIAGMLMKITRRKVKWVAHLSDPWLTNPFASFNPWTRMLNLMLERISFGLADQIIFTSELTKARAIARYPALGSKAEFLAHSYDSRLFPMQKERQQTHQGITLRYMGNFYGGRNARPLAEALRALEMSNPEIFKQLRIEVIGQSQYKETCEHITFKPEVSYLESLALMRDADGLLLVDAPAQESEFFPSKLVDYLGSGRPILGLTPPGVARTILEEHGFACVEPDSSPQILAKALAEFCRGLNQVSIDPGVEKYEISNVGQRFLNLILPKVSDAL